ncbi:hypothetical protein VTN77DRAFT_4282 [Rasamsonia byssochlamydoides]|uniref:uncharacterized protein n=1 Tax=Rasamsonia byssochlamydoides TaxID=89139 RepID=UPI0037447DD4
MGHKASVVQGVRSENYYEPGNAINEIWLGDVEIVSRLPFGDSDMAQAGWPEGDWPKIPWHPFLIPLRRKLTERGEPEAPALVLCDGKFCACRQWGGPFTNLSTLALVCIWVCFFTVLHCSTMVPTILKRVRRYCYLTHVDLGRRQSMLRTWLCIGFATLVVSATLTVLGTFTLPAMFFCQNFPRDTRVWVDTHLYFYPYMLIMHCAWGVVIVLANWRLAFELCRLCKTYDELRRISQSTTDDPSIPTTASTDCNDPTPPSGEEEQATCHPPRQGVSLDSRRTTARTSHGPRHSSMGQNLKSVSDPGADDAGIEYPRPSLHGETRQRDQSRHTTDRSLKSQLDAEDIELDALSKWISS